LVSYIEVFPLSDSKIYLITAATILTYIIIFSLTIKIFIPKYLFNGKYLQFVICIIINAIIFEIIPNIVFYRYFDNYDFFSKSIIIDNLSSFVIFILCISGVIIPIFLRNWMTSSQHLSQLKKKQRSSEIEQLKEQINPVSFFKTLNKSRSLVKNDPDRASALLMKLSQLLRYQLYDCNRSYVLLSSEISFLRNFLELEKLNSLKFSYIITTTGDINGILVPPSILLPYVQSAVNSLDGEKDIQKIDVHITYENETIRVELKTKGILSISSLKNELLKIKDRLDTLYENHYTLTVHDNIATDDVEVNLKLEKR